MNGFMKFNRGLVKLPLPWRLWVGLLVLGNLVIPLLFITRLEAQVTAAAFLAGGGLMVFLTARAGFTRLLGLGHIFWIPLLAFLWTRLDTISPAHFFGVWVRLLIFFNAVSLIIDAVDVIRYLRGEREEIIPGL